MFILSSKKKTVDFLFEHQTLIDLNFTDFLCLNFTDFSAQKEISRNISVKMHSLDISCAWFSISYLKLVSFNLYTSLQGWTFWRQKTAKSNKSETKLLKINLKKRQVDFLSWKTIQIKSSSWLMCLFIMQLAKIEKSLTRKPKKTWRRNWLTSTVWRLVCSEPLSSKYQINFQLKRALKDRRVIDRTKLNYFFILSKVFFKKNTAIKLATNSFTLLNQIKIESDFFNHFIKTGN